MRTLRTHISVKLCMAFSAVLSGYETALTEYLKIEWDMA